VDTPHIKLNPATIKRDALIGGGLIVGAVLIAKFAPMLSGSVPSTVDASGAMIPTVGGGFGVSNPAPYMPGQAPGYGTTPPNTTGTGTTDTGAVPLTTTPPVNTMPARRPDGPVLPGTPNVLPVIRGGAPIIAGCHILPNGTPLGCDTPAPRPPVQPIGTILPGTPGHLPGLR
jgi:hypothetical protein